MQGKACFNFTKVDDGLLTELEALTARGIPAYRPVADQAAVGLRA
jgi:hypothetical protein